MMNETLFIPINSGVCELKQLSLIESTAKLPHQAYYVLVLGLVFLLFYFFVQPRLGEKINGGLSFYPGLAGTLLVFLGCWVMFWFVFQISGETLSWLNRWAWVAVLFLLFLIVWVKRKAVLSYLKSISTDGGREK